MERDEPPVDVVIEVVAEKPPPTIYSAPRRFDIATIMVVTIAYAVLFSGLRLLNAAPHILAAATFFVSVVGLAQSLLYGGKHPRVASIHAGIASMLVLLAFFFFTLDAPVVCFLVSGFLFVIPGGAAFGYIAGVLVGSVFMIADWVRRWSSSKA
ncbi:MAG: hypothetical protein KDA42_07895 [Planctomycetales bacterium]|nr:hypothetical protein [Planctomycetales bacterium]